MPGYSSRVTPQAITTGEEYAAEATLLRSQRLGLGRGGSFRQVTYTADCYCSAVPVGLERFDCGGAKRPGHGLVASPCGTVSLHVVLFPTPITRFPSSTLAHSTKGAFWLGIRVDDEEG